MPLHKTVAVVLLASGAYVLGGLAGDIISELDEDLQSKRGYAVSIVAAISALIANALLMRLLVIAKNKEKARARINDG